MLNVYLFQAYSIGNQIKINGSIPSEGKGVPSVQVTNGVTITIMDISCH